MEKHDYLLLILGINAGRTIKTEISSYIPTMRLIASNPLKYDRMHNS